MKIAGKTVLITGGARRIGRALAEAFAEAGASVIIHCRHSRTEAETLCRSLPGPGRHAVVQADFALPGAAEQLFTQIPGRLDLLINCAAAFVNRPIAEEDDAEAERQFRVNFLAPLELMRRFVRQTDFEGGAIVNFLDQQIVRHPTDTGSYLLAKQALADATLTAARQFAPTCRVNAIAPGPVLPPVGTAGPGFQKVLTGVPLGRPVAMDDLSAACLFLVTNDSITGQVLFVDGGQHLS